MSGYLVKVPGFPVTIHATQWAVLESPTGVPKAHQPGWWRVNLSRHIKGLRKTFHGAVVTKL